jgi:predicted dehydrogenase
MKPVALAIVGVGGYGRTYMDSIAQMEKEGCGKLVSAVIRNRAKYPTEVADLEKRGVAIRESLTELLAKDGNSVEIVALPTGIPMHCPQMIEAANARKNVILEKPPTATIQEMDAMLAALKQNGTWCQVGFQSQGNPTVMALKRLICAGKLGVIRHVTVQAKWVRRDSYYARNPWAGKIRVDGSWVLDGTVINPTAHYLMNGMYFANPVWGEIAEPEWVQAELYRAHHIEAEDTSCLRIQTKEGPVIHFFATLAASVTSPVVVTVEGDKGRAVWQMKGDTVVEYKDGGRETIPGQTDESYRHDVFRNPIRYLRGEAKELNCALAMTRNYVLAMNGAWLSGGVPHKIPDGLLKMYHDPKADSRAIEIPGIEQLIDLACEQRKLFSELGTPWAVKSNPFRLKGYHHFDLSLP